MPADSALTGVDTLRASTSFVKVHASVYASLKGRQPLGGQAWMHHIPHMIEGLIQLESHMTLR